MAQQQQVLEKRVEHFGHQFDAQTNKLQGHLEDKLAEQITRIEALLSKRSRQEWLVLQKSGRVRCHGTLIAKVLCILLFLGDQYEDWGSNESRTSDMVSFHCQSNWPCRKGQKF